ncbi:MAG: hypothetical protein RLZZ05_109, partial [Bacteroidota bacterium]
MNKTSLNRFFSNQCSPIEREEIIRWLLDPSNDLLIKHWLREHWDTLSVNELVADQDEPDMEKIWGKIRSSIKENQLKSGLEKAPSGFNKFHFKKIAVAAIMIGVLLSIYFIYTANSVDHMGLADANLKPSNDIAPPAQARATLKL